MAKPITLMHKEQPELINPDQILRVEYAGEGRSNIYFAGNSYKQFDLSVAQIHALWLGEEAPANDTPETEPPSDTAETAIVSSRKKPVPPETK